MLLQRARAHEQADMAARHGLLHDAVLRRAEIFRGVKDLLRRRDVVVCAGQQIGRAGDVVQIELAAQPDESRLWRAGSP